jgi:hypothetical protein
LLSTSVLALKYEYELNRQEKSKFCKFIPKEGLSPSGIALFFGGFGTLFGFHLTALSVFTFCFSGFQLFRPEHH